MGAKVGGAAEGAGRELESLSHTDSARGPSAARALTVMARSLRQINFSAAIAKHAHCRFTGRICFADWEKRRAVARYSRAAPEIRIF